MFHNLPICRCQKPQLRDPLYPPRPVRLVQAEQCGVSIGRRMHGNVVPPWNLVNFISTGGNKTGERQGKVAEPIKMAPKTKMNRKGSRRGKRVEKRGTNERAGAGKD